MIKRMILLLIVCLIAGLYSVEHVVSKADSTQILSLSFVELSPTRTPESLPPTRSGPTPVNKDFLPAVFRQEGTPTATLPPGVTPTIMPTKTKPPLPPPFSAP